MLDRFIPIIGIATFIAIAFSLSNHRSKIEWRLVGWGLSLQVILCLLVLGVPALGISGPIRFLFEWASMGVNAILNYSLEGSRFLFGDLVNTEKFGYIIAFQILPTIVFMSSLMAVLYHLKVMQVFIRATAWAMQKSMKTSGAETLSAAANIFVGQTEAPLVVKPFIQKMTQSELFCVMTGGMATVAGGVLAAYVGLLKARMPDIAGHLLTASVLSAPAALMFAKIMIPETKTPETAKDLPKEADKSPHANVIDAAASGASEGLKLSLNVGAMLFAFVALIALVNGILGQIGSGIQFDHWYASVFPNNPTQTLSVQFFLSWFFAPLAWIMGVPSNEVLIAGTLLGEKIVLNEFFAYVHLAEISEQLSDRSIVILSYALCGFANFSSIAIQLGGIGGIAPNRRKELALFGMRSIIAGSFACFSTACIVGLFL